ncbi:DUF1788 domain-containing protein [Isachenkonia alkalipeptolytica]|uniref:DUF1788 domain-containing protein n=1 Tax=Isachenkonia alkalipeptolytica TaxID=2565777 RepID=A0AA44BE30_9CLOT|nr:DUF1788 domain-containing protein [Isachenkonia alkalipeptolytica]NBG87675.1 DUF1788 domain-containing protein [Isachenkonia alkalipeptolytica]
MSDILKKLDKIKPIIEDPRFLEGKGLGNEIGFYIFDYDPKEELLVRDHIRLLKEKCTKSGGETLIQEFDLYEMMLDILEDKGYLQKVFDMEKKKGTEALVKPIKNTLRLTMKNDLIVKYIKERLADDKIVFLTGVGKAWPLIRSHTVLNVLHSVIDHVPVVMFYPGSYTGRELSLFNEINDQNYYRAFQLVGE